MVAWPRVRAALPALVVVVSVVVACAAGCTKHDVAAKRLVIATTAEPDALCALLTESGTAQEVVALVADDLVVDVPAPTAQLAAAVPSLANGGARVVDGKLVVTWRIRDGASWEDGVAVTAADFVFGWRVQS